MLLYLKSRINIGPALLLVLLLSSYSLSAQADGFQVRSVATELKDKVYLLNARIDYRLSNEVVEALQNGVPLIILLDIEVKRERHWWFDKTIAELQQGYLILYHALSETYIVNNLNSGAQKNFTSMNAALRSLGHIEDLPIIDTHLVKPDAKHYVELKTYLDIESLPAPMRPIAYLSPKWRLETDWYQWPLQP
jgi:hypothetical protein